MTNYLQGKMPYWQLNKLDGTPASTYSIWIRDDEDRTKFSRIYSDIKGTPLKNPVYFFADGDVPAIYFDANKVYYLQFRDMSGNIVSEYGGYNGLSVNGTASLPTINFINNSSYLFGYDYEGKNIYDNYSLSNFISSFSSETLSLTCKSTISPSSVAFSYEIIGIYDLKNNNYDLSFDYDGNDLSLDILLSDGVNFETLTTIPVNTGSISEVISIPDLIAYTSNVRLIFSFNSISTINVSDLIKISLFNFSSKTLSETVDQKLFPVSKDLYTGSSPVYESSGRIAKFLSKIYRDDLILLDGINSIGTFSSGAIYNGERYKLAYRNFYDTGKIFSPWVNVGTDKWKNSNALDLIYLQGQLLILLNLEGITGYDPSLFNISIEFQAYQSGSFSGSIFSMSTSPCFFNGNVFYFPIGNVDGLLFSGDPENIDAFLFEIDLKNDTKILNKMFFSNYVGNGSNYTSYLSSFQALTTGNPNYQSALATNRMQQNSIVSSLKQVNFDNLDFYKPFYDCISNCINDPSKQYISNISSDWIGTSLLKTGNSDTDYDSNLRLIVPNLMNKTSINLPINTSFFMYNNLSGAPFTADFRNEVSLETGITNTFVDGTIEDNYIESYKYINGPTYQSMTQLYGQRVDGSTKHGDIGKFIGALTEFWYYKV